tara:strand:+ start:591 stop:1133 length:543 start_codon:yes stop_codon:yes gene_type:complete
MHTHIGRGIGKFIEEELFKAKDYVKVCSPNISYSLSKRLFGLLDNQVKIQVITSDIITGKNNTEQANSLAKEIIHKYEKNDDIEKSPLECKVISTKDIALIHAKIYVIDGKCAIMGSANLTENSFHNFAEYVLISDEIEIVKKIENDYDSFWLELDSFPNQITNKTMKGLFKNFKNKLTD